MAAGHLVDRYHSLLDLPVLDGLFSLGPIVQNDVPSRPLSVSFHLTPRFLKVELLAQKCPCFGFGFLFFVLVGCTPSVEPSAGLELTTQIKT